ncbi:MauE/DoxX family redox-associated membrane protein [Nonomuraea sp. SYSU D8015]|uniref:MauE/DoxX family redox-associated membrane protein n=1 Tax=Nonomuraea sp. SYSU D8015 TaxID=2593644 RepID=UPI0016610557|nr:MauE/DoxX family redox-associated membrane protein [Nonomuraea sp. SYSU D8015]
MTHVLESQLPILIVLLVLGTVAKVATVRSGGEPGALSRLGPAVLVPDRMKAPVMVACAAGELVMAAGLLLTTHPIFRWGTVAFFALSTYVLLELRRRRPDAGCGCFGEVSSAPVGLRSIGRTVALTVMSVMSVWAPVTGWEAAIRPSWLMAAGVAVLLALSPEIEEMIDRVRFRAPCEQRRGPAESVVLSRLRASGTWRAHEGELASAEPYDSWRELCWRFFAFRDQDQNDVVFAVYLSGRRPAVRMAVVSAEDSGSLPEYTPVSA